MTVSQKRLSRKERRSNRQSHELNKEGTGLKINFQLKAIEPLTQNQKKSFELFNTEKHLLLHGIAGTGKSFISLYLSLKELMKPNSQYENIVIIRSVVPTRDMGFLPGNNKEKTKVYESPYMSICSELYGRGDAYEYLKQKNLIEFMSTSFVRGVTFNNSIIIVDEMQNMDWGELSSVITRVGKNCKIIFCGDFRQSDFRFKEKESKSDVLNFMNVLKKMPDDFGFIEFNAQDIVRSKLVKNFILTTDKMGLSL